MYVTTPVGEARAFTLPVAAGTIAGALSVTRQIQGTINAFDYPAQGMILYQ